ncbi:MAG: AmmeMemoRadiSam system protein B [Acidobacteriota bacterium]|nr:MAG: AmmeMemoRadiSam system protein B [Acidobacteriota bacterium]
MRIIRLIGWGVLMTGISSCLAGGCETAEGQSVRKPAVAGQFYPSDPVKLNQAIDQFIGEAVPPLPARPAALVVPHAGYIYSGQIAADAFRQAQGHQYDLIVLLGPNHTTPSFRGISVYKSGVFETPLGRSQIAEDVADELISASRDVSFHEGVHRREHSIEVQIPFVQKLFPSARILPIVVATEDLETCARFGRLLAEKLKGQRSLLVASSDLSHYPAYDQAVDADLASIAAISRLEPKPLQQALHQVTGVLNLSTQACGEAPILVTVSAALQSGTQFGVPISYANSGDSSVGTHDRVVGYGAVAFYSEPPTPSREIYRTIATDPGDSGMLALSSEQKKTLLEVARNTMNRYFTSGITPLIRVQEAPFSFRMGVFVTLRINTTLRGCIGHMVADLPLAQAVSYTTMQAAFNDRRFEPIGESELTSLDIEVSILTPEQRIHSVDEIRLGTDGVVLRKLGRSAVFLPRVAIEQGWSRDEMLSALALKAGLNKDDWQAGAEFAVFQTIAFKESELAREPEVAP